MKFINRFTNEIISDQPNDYNCSKCDTGISRCENCHVIKKTNLFKTSGKQIFNHKNIILGPVYDFEELEKMGIKIIYNK